MRSKYVGRGTPAATTGKEYRPKHCFLLSLWNESVVVVSISMTEELHLLFREVVVDVINVFPLVMIELVKIRLGGSSVVGSLNCGGVLIHPPPGDHEKSKIPPLSLTISRKVG